MTNPPRSAGEAAKKKKKEEAEAAKRQEAELDKALADSFPASDPPAPAIKGTTSNPKPDEKTPR